MGGGGGGGVESVPPSVVLNQSIKYYAKSYLSDDSLFDIPSYISYNILRKNLVECKQLILMSATGVFKPILCSLIRLLSGRQIQ